MVAMVRQQRMRNPTSAAPREAVASIATGELHNSLRHRRKRCFVTHRYAAQKWCNPFCRQDYRKFLKFVGWSYRNYLSDGPSLLVPHYGVTRGVRWFAGGSLPCLSHLRLCARIGSLWPAGGKRLPACPHLAAASCRGDPIWHASRCACRRVVRFRPFNRVSGESDCSASRKSNGFDRCPPAMLADAKSNHGTDQKDLTQPNLVTKDRPDPDICGWFAQS